MEAKFLQGIKIKFKFGMFRQEKKWPFIRAGTKLIEYALVKIWRL
jgi:hypothetical protein